MVYGVPRNCYPLMIVSNEPNAIAPYGDPKTPSQYLALMQSIRYKCPNSTLVVGNVSSENWSKNGGWNGTGYDWLVEFLPLTNDKNIIVSAHCYWNTAAWCINEFSRIRNLAIIKLGNGNNSFWTTEFGITNGDPIEMKKLLGWLDRKSGAYFVFTNTQPSACNGQKQGWEITQGVNLVNCDGSLNPMGQVFSDFGRSEIAR